jgi:hypothetical protein
VRGPDGTGGQRLIVCDNAVRRLHPARGCAQEVAIDLPPRLGRGIDTP